MLKRDHRARDINRGVLTANLASYLFLLIVVVGLVFFSDELRGHRYAGSEASAVGSLRTLNTAEITYASTYPDGYSPTLSSLGPPPEGTNPSATGAALVDSVLAGTTGNSSEKYGYHFFYAPGPRDAKGRINSYSIMASPVQPGVTGTNYYYTDQTGAIRQNRTAPASAADSPLDDC